MERSSIVDVRGLYCAYPGRSSREDVLRGVSLAVSAGESVAVMGPSGSGKSTLLNCAAGLLPASRGTVRVDDLDVTSASEKQLTVLRRDRLGFIFQDYNLLSALTAEHNVGLPARFSGRPRSRAVNLEALARVGLKEKAGARPDQLSGGQRQRVAIARALAAKPAVVFADEPTGSLDVASGAQVLSLLEELMQQGTALLMVTHDPQVAARADRVVLLFDGVIVEELVGCDAAGIATSLAAFEAEVR